MTPSNDGASFLPPPNLRRKAFCLKTHQRVTRSSLYISTGDDVTSYFRLVANCCRCCVQVAHVSICMCVHKRFRNKWLASRFCTAAPIGGLPCFFSAPRTTVKAVGKQINNAFVCLSVHAVPISVFVRLRRANKTGSRCT